MRYLVFAICLAVSSMLGWYVFQESQASVAKEAKKKEDKPISVVAVQVQSRNIQEAIELVGNLEAVSELNVRTRVAGYVREMNLDIEQPVKAGQDVVVLDDRSHHELLAKAQAAEAVAKAQLEAQEARRDQVAKEVKRLKTLTGISTPQQLEDAESRLAVANAEYKLQQAQLDQAVSDVKRAQFAMEELRITTPIDGFVAERNVDVGDLAKPEDVLLRIVDLRQIQTVVHVVERDYHQIKNGQVAEIRVDAVPDRTFEGRVVRKSPVLDQDTRTGKVIIEVANDPNLSLKPGMHARVTIVAAKKPNAAVIPDTALHDRDGRQFVYVVEGTPETAQQRDVRIGIIDGGSIEVLGGLSKSDRVITLGSRLVKEGARVEVTLDPWTLPAISESPSTGDSAGE